MATISFNDTIFAQEALKAFTAKLAPLRAFSRSLDDSAKSVGDAIIVPFISAATATTFNSSTANYQTGGGAVKGPPDPMVVGKRLFTANCVACHQATGQGVAGQFPTLVGSEWVLSGDWHGDNHLVQILLHGLQGPIQVKGSTYNGAMPPWKQLKDEQIAMILTYIRNEWGNSAPPITAEQVAKVREETATQTEPYTQNQLKAIPAIKYDSAPPAAPAEGEAVPPAPTEAQPAATPAAA